MQETPQNKELSRAELSGRCLPDLPSPESLDVKKSGTQFSQETKDRVCKYLTRNPHISPTMAAQALSLSSSTVNAIKRQLIDEGKLLPPAKQGARGKGLW